MEQLDLPDEPYIIDLSPHGKVSWAAWRVDERVEATARKGKSSGSAQEMVGGAGCGCAEIDLCLVMILTARGQVSEKIEQLRVECLALDKEVKRTCSRACILSSVCEPHGKNSAEARTRRQARRGSCIADALVSALARHN